MDEQNTVQQAPQVECDSGPGPLDVMEAELTLRLAATHQRERRVLEELAATLERTQAGGLPVWQLPRWLQGMALDLATVLHERRTLESLQRGDQW